MDIRCRLDPRYQTTPWLRAKRKRWRAMHEAAACTGFGLIAMLALAGWHFMPT